MKNAKLSIVLIVLLLLHTLTVAFSFQYFFRTEPKSVNSGLTILAPLPVGHWKFDEGSGTVAHDSSGYGHDATIYGADWVAGKKGSALCFDGVEDRVEVEHDASLNPETGSFTVTAWVKPGMVLETPDHQRIVWKNDGVPMLDGYYLSLLGSSFIFGVGDGTSKSEPMGGVAETGVWHFVVGVRDRVSGKCSVFLNGVQVNERTDSSGNVDYNGKLLFGGRHDYGVEFFNGEIDDVRIYNRALTQQEIQMDMSDCHDIRMSIAPLTETTSIGGTATYDVEIANYADVPDNFTLTLQGLNASWCSLSRTSLWIVPGELAHVQLDVTVPEDPSSIGDYSFNVTLSGAWTQKTVEALLNVVQNPIMLDLQPCENNTIVGSTDLLISWRTTTNSSSEVYVKNVNDSAFTLVAGDWSKEHFVCVHNLTRNNDYVWYIRSATIHGEVSSDQRILHVSNGISFTQDAYAFNVERDYAQHASISVVNTDTQSHDLLLQTLNPYEDLIVGFVGAGSIDQNVTLQPSETRSVDLYVHAQDAEQENYTFAIQLTNLGPENISDYALVQVDVRWPNTNLSLVELSSDSWTLSKTLRVINNGDPITDLQIYGSDELLGKVLFRPTIWHAYIGSRESLTFDVVPVLTSDFTSYHGFVLAEGAGTIVASLQVDFALPPGKNVFRVEAPQMTIEFCRYYDMDESPNTNPQSDRPVESYVVNNTLIFFSQVIVDVCQNGAPVSGANVSFTVWNETISSTLSSCTLFAGKAKFEFAGGIGTYHYKAVLLDYGASTEERTFSVSTFPLFQIEPNQITWLEISDGNSTFGDVTENTTVVMDKGPYTFKATQNGIDENMTFNLCLTWEYDAYKKIHVPGTIQGNQLVFQTETIPVGNYTACVLSYSSGIMKTSFPIRVECVDYLSMYYDGNFSYNTPLPLNSTHILKLKIDHSISSRDERISFDLVDIDSNDTHYLLMFAAISNETTSSLFQFLVTSDSEVLYNATLSLQLEAYVSTVFNMTVLIRNNTIVYDFNVTLAMSSSAVYLQIHPTIDYTYNAFIWVGEEYGILKFLHLENNPTASLVRCGVGTCWSAITRYLPIPPGFRDLLIFAPDFLDIVGEVLADKLTMDELLKGIKGGGISYLIQGNRLKGLRNAFIQRVAERFGQKCANIVGWSLPLIGDALNIWGCMEDWGRIWRSTYGEGFVDSVIGFVRHCTNKPVVSFDFDLSLPTMADPHFNESIDVDLVPRFLLPWPKSSYCPHDISIWLNDQLVARFTMTVPIGHYGLPINPEYLIFPSGGTARNRITIQTQYLNGGNYVVATGMLLSILYSRVQTYLVATSSEEATSRMNELMGSKFANKEDPAVFSEDIDVGDNLCEGIQKLNVTVWNLGSTLAFQVPVQVFDGKNLIEQVLATLPPFGNATFTVEWNASAGPHQLEVVIDPFNTRDEMDESNNLAIRSIVVNSRPMHDIAVNNIKPSKNSTGQATNTYLNLTVTNQGDFTETFNLTLYVDTTAIQTENITLQGRNSAIIVFLWNTTGFALGNYTISAYAWPVLNETSTADNNVTDGWILVTIPGDVDGNFKVDMGDISVLCDGFGSTIGADGNYWHKPTCILCPHSPNFDIDWNGRLDMGDIVTALDHFGQRYP